MKRILPPFIFGILIYSCSSTKTGSEKTKCFNENNIEISQSKFNQERHIGNCYKADLAYGKGVAKALDINPNGLDL